MKSSQRGVVNGGVLVVLIGGLMIGGLFIHSYSTEQELPLWPALAVIGVNLYGAWRIFSETRARRRARGNAPGSGDKES